jgi:hypothetical protein
MKSKLGGEYMLFAVSALLGYQKEYPRPFILYNTI